VDDIRVGLAIRAMRERRGWRQSDLADRARVSQALISLIERGHLVRVSFRALRRILEALDAKLDMRVLSQSGEADRLIDRKHASIVERVIAILRAAGWEVRAEVTFSEYGERGSIDIFAWHAAKGAVLLIEVKSDVYSIEETVRRLDVKVRLAPTIAWKELGWRPRIIGSALVLPESSGIRRRLDGHQLTFASALPHRGRDLREWLKAPNTSLAAVWFLSGSNEAAGSRPAVRRIRAKSASGPSDSDLVAARRAADGPVMPPSRIPATTLIPDGRRELARMGFVVDE
jgi:transcriptional regulator with XRE-family HTH domain